MSTLEQEQMDDLQRPERAVAIRRFDTEVEADGRTVSFRIAPFKELAISADGLGGVPKGVPYKEELMPGLYDRQLRAANRILLNFEHKPGIANVVGHGVEMWSADDGYHASFRIHETSAGETALTLAQAGSLSAASVESYWLKSIRTVQGIVQRVKGHLDAVAMCREGAYPSALLTGIRGEEVPEGEIILDETLLPIDPDPELLERCRALGIRLPQRYEAHPAETDTPAETGTSEGGTRQPEEQSNSEVQAP